MFADHFLLSGSYVRLHFFSIFACATCTTDDVVPSVGGSGGFFTYLKNSGSVPLHSSQVLFHFHRESTIRLREIFLSNGCFWCSLELFHYIASRSLELFETTLQRTSISWYFPPVRFSIALWRHDGLCKVQEIHLLNIGTCPSNVQSGTVNLRLNIVPTAWLNIHHGGHVY